MKTTNTWIFFILTSLVTVFAGSGSMTAASRASDDRRPNVVIFLTDDQGTLDANCYGSTDLYTPAMDELAANGVRFTQAYCAAPSCTPSRNAILTGQDIWRLGPGGQLFGTLPAEQPVYTDLLTESGYRVGYSDKANP